MLDIVRNLNLYLLFTLVIMDGLFLCDAGHPIPLDKKQREDPNIRLTDDAVIIDVGDELLHPGRVRHRREVDGSRKERQLLLQNSYEPVTYYTNPFNQFQIPPANSLQRVNPYSINVGGLSLLNRAPNTPSLGPRPPHLPHAPCFTASGQLGKCASFRECYPYFKVPNLSSWGPWMFGSLDICNYYSEQPKQPDVFQTLGVCCINPLILETSTVPSGPPVVAPIDEPSISRPGESPQQGSDSEVGGTGSEKNVLANWPPTHPPLPTHPPDHTAPTHPPGFGHPAVNPTQKPVTQPPLSTTKKPITTTWGTKPPNQPWPPTAPTHPAMTTTTVSTVPGPQGVSTSCGIKNGLQDQERIVGGHNAELHEWPWVVALFKDGKQFCGGSLIDSSHILTAAHCVAHMTSYDVSRVTARLGDYDIKTNTETRHVEKRIRRVVRHRGFDIRILHNDIALLTLDTPATFSKEIRPICLSRGGESYAGSQSTVIGWGSLRESGPQPGILQEVSIPIWTNAECRSKYGSAAPGGIVDHMLCAGRVAKDSCSGDSGGPLMVATGGRWTQVGIVSWGIGCGKGNYPGVYSRVSSFIPWIDKNSKD